MIKLIYIIGDYMKHSISYYLSKIEFFLNDKFSSIFENSILNNINIKVLLTIYILLIVFLITILIISMWKIFKRNSKPGYYALIPGLNLWILFKLSGLKGYLSLIILISFVLIFILINKLLLIYAIIPLLVIVGMLILLYVRLSITYNKNKSYSIGLLLLPLIFFPMLAFDNNKNEYFEIVEFN